MCVVIAKMPDPYPFEKVGGMQTPCWLGQGYLTLQNRDFLSCLEAAAPRLLTPEVHGESFH